LTGSEHTKADQDVFEAHHCGKGFHLEVVIKMVSGKKVAKKQFH
jgi:hypothetical protein